MDASHLTALIKSARCLVALIAVLLAVGFALAAPGVPDRPQVLVVLGTMCGTLLGLTLTTAAFVFRLHADALATDYGRDFGFTRGMKSFWRTIFSVAVALAASVLASVFGILDPAGAASLDLMVVAGIGLIGAVLFVPLIVADLWGVLVVSQKLASAASPGVEQRPR
jgi:hypothetical protein